MIRFECDYAEGAHEKILENMMRTNLEQTAGYSEDVYSDHARALIRQACGKEDLDVHFLVGGTQTNLTVIASVLRPHQGVLCAVSGHVNVHETGAIEATGHKVLAMPSTDGKITAAQVQEAYDAHWRDESREHVVQPGMVYISQPTENGTLYSKEELTALHETCVKCGLPLYVDGARLGYGMAAPTNDVTLKDLAELSDIFYIGGTKVGALFGEAVVIANPAYGKDFRYIIKQRGGMLAKGRLLGIQFETLFTDGLYFEISKHAVDLAMKIRKACEEKGFGMQFDSYTNQQFPILPNALVAELRQKYAFYTWQKVDEDHTSVRFCTSWATDAENVEQLLADIRAFGA